MLIERINTAFLQARDICGINKLMGGSDYHRTITAITYKMAQDFVINSNRLTPEEKRLFLGENATNFYRFNTVQNLPKIKNMLKD